MKIYLNGYNSCRRKLQIIIVKNPELQENEELMKIAQYSYYEEDGIDWIPDCYNCKNRHADINNIFICVLNINLNKIKKCKRRE